MSISPMTIEDPLSHDALVLYFRDVRDFEVTKAKIENMIGQEHAKIESERKDLVKKEKEERNRAEREIRQAEMKMSQEMNDIRKRGEQMRAYRTIRRKIWARDFTVGGMLAVFGFVLFGCMFLASFFEAEGFLPGLFFWC